jgi:YD repeat-containing protein
VGESLDHLEDGALVGGGELFDLLESLEQAGPRTLLSRAITRRSYYPSGRLACEHQLIKRWGALDTTSASQFVIRYYYDLDGRLIRKAFGAGSYYSTLDLWPGACYFAFQTDSATVRYTYDSRGRVDSLVGGNLASGITAAYRVHYDGANRRDSLVNTARRGARAGRSTRTASRRPTRGTTAGR